MCSGRRIANGASASGLSTNPTYLISVIPFDVAPPARRFPRFPNPIIPHLARTVDTVLKYARVICYVFPFPEGVNQTIFMEPGIKKKHLLRTQNLCSLRLVPFVFLCSRKGKAAMDTTRKKQRLNLGISGAHAPPASVSSERS